MDFLQSIELTNENNAETETVETIKKSIPNIGGITLKDWNGFSDLFTVYF